MALTDKDILITPNKGAASDPKIDFIGASASTSGTITMTVLTASGTTLAFTGTVGTLFQISNTASTLTAVVSIPSTVNATGTTTGALVVSGGVAVGQDLRVGGLIYGTLAGQVSAASQVVVTNDITSSTVNFITFVNTSSGNAGVRTAASTGMVYVPSTGFFAVGTTNPTERLTVGNGNIQLDNNRAIKFKSVAGVVGNVLRFGSDNHTYLESPASGNIIFRTGATLTDRLQILPSGYVGIGTAANSVTTDFPLHVYGDVSGGQIAVENGSGSTTRQAGINYRIDGADIWQTYVNNADGSNSWRIKYNNANDYFTVDTAGNAALGTVTPGDAIISPAPARYFEIYGNGGNPALRLNGNALNQTTIQLVAGVPNVSTSGFTILDETAGANRLSIDSSGRTSINTSTVGNNNFYLDVWGSIGASAGSITIGSGGAILPGSMYSNSSYGMLIRANRASPSQAQFLWQTSAGSEILRIDPNLNLGFGTTAAFEKFVMLGAANTATNPGMSYNMVINASNALTTATLSNVGAGIALGGITTGTTTATFAIISGVKENATYSDTAGAFIIGTRVSGGNVTEKLRVTSAGSVGVGTITPTNRFQVVGGNYTIGIADSASGNRARLFWQTTSGSVGVGLFNDDNSNLMFGTNNTERVRIDVNGNVFVYNGYLKTTGGIADDNGGNLALQVLAPGGGSTATTAATVTGAIKIRLPQGYTDTMMRMTVKVYTYNNNSFDITLGGYQNAGGSAWLNTFAYMNTTAMTQLNVRFGYDGTYNCIFIGETNSTWSYPQVFVTDFQAGYNSYAYTQWVKNWSITYYTGAAFANTAAGQYITKTEVAYPTWNKGGTNGLINVSQLTNDAGYLTASNTVAKYTIGNNGVQPCWIYLGRWNTSQQGYTLRMTITAMQGYNASSGQDQFTEVFFKTSNTASALTGSTGNFYANGQLYRTGGNTNGPQTVRVVQIDQSTYDFYAYFPGLVGQGSMYEVTTSVGTWVNSSTVVTPSGNYIDLTWYTNYTSQSLTNLSQLNNDVPFYKSGDSPTFGTVTANSYAWNGSGSTAGYSMLNMTHDSQTLFNGSPVLGDGVNADQLAFNMPNTAEYYNGTAWSSTTVSTFYDAFRGKLSHRFGGNIALNSSTQQRIRFTWTSWGYKFWNGIVLAGNAQGNNIWLTLETSADGSTWTTQINDVDIGGGWPNYNYVRNISNNSGSSPYLRITIRRNTTGANAGNLVYVNNISIIGSYGSYNNLFDWDYNRNITFPGSLYAPTYYDSNNSNYYVDPASSSLVSTFTAAGLLKGTYDGGSPGYTNWQISASPAANGAFIAVNRASTSAGEAGFAWASAGGAPTWINYLPTSSTTLGWYAGAGVGVAMTLDTAGALVVTASVSSPIYYDKNNTAFYADPDGTSKLNGLNLDATLGFRRGSGDYNTYIKANGYPAQSYANADGTKYWLELGAYGGVHVILNTDGGVGSAENSYDHFTVWQGNNNGNRLFWSTNVGNVSAATSFRAPIFYDTDNTGYYVDPSSTSNINALDTAGNIRIQPAVTTSGADLGLGIYHGNDANGYGRIRFYQNGSNFQTIHSFGTGWQGGTLNGTSTGAININGNAGVTFGAWNAISASIDNSGNIYFRKWWDLDDAAYYVDPNGTSRFNVINFNQMGGNKTRYSVYDSSNNLLATPSGLEYTGAFYHFIGGAAIAPYATYRSSGDWPVPYGIGFGTGGESSGIFQRFASNGSSLGEMIFYTGNDGSGSFAWRRHTWESTSYNGSGSNQLATAMMILDWGQNLYVYGSTRSPIFYDLDNTSYYANPAGQSFFYQLNIENNGGTAIFIGNGSVSTSNPLRINFHTDGDLNYYIGKPAGSWVQPLHIAFYTGIKLGAHYAYGGTKIYHASDMGTELASFGNGDLHTRINYNLYAPIMYDSNNTGYYVDPNSTTQLNVLLANHMYNGVVSSGGLSAGTWYTIAANSGNRASARFQIVDQTSGLHQTVVFYAAHHFGTDGSNAINVISNSYYGGPPIGYIRIKENSTYEGAVVQVYVANACSGVRVFMYDNEQDGNGWVLVNWVPDSTNPGTVANWGALSERSRVYLMGDRNSLTMSYAGFGLGYDSKVRLFQGNSINSDPMLRIQTEYTYGDFGALNTSWFHHSTGASGFYWYQYGQNASSWRAPIFYDSDDTGYYLDPNTTSAQALRIRGGAFFGPNPTWGEYLRVGANGDSGDYAQIMTTNGNLHLDGRRGGYGIYLNWYNGASVYVYNDIQAQIYYDRNDTGYYVDPNGVSNLRGSVYVGNGYSYVSYAYNNNGGFAMNNASTYWGLMSNIGANDWRIGYGSQTGYVGWNLRWDNGGTTWSNYSHRAPLFYDSDNTGYYVDPNSDSNMWRLATYMNPRYQSTDWADAFRNTPASSYAYHGDVSAGGPTGTWWFYESYRHGNGSNYWGTQIAWGWEDNANQLYQRNITYNSFSAWRKYWNTGHNLSSSIFYDADDSSYYLDPNSYSRVSNMYFTGWARFYGNQGLYNQDYGVHFYGQDSEGWSITGSGGIVKLLFRSNHQSTVRGYVYGDTSNNFGFLNQDGNWRLRIVGGDYGLADGSSMRAQIFYDSNDTTYYVNPNGDTYLYGGIWNNGAHGSSRIMNRLLSGNNGAGTGEVRLQMWCSEPGNTWDWAGFGYNVDNNNNSDMPAYYFGRPNPAFGQAYMRFGTGGQWYFYTATNGYGAYSGSRYTHIYLAPGNGVETYGILWNDSSLRTYIFYDRADTGYYSDPNSTSVLWRPSAATQQRWSAPWRAMDDNNHRPNMTGDSDYWTTTMGWGTSYGVWSTFWKYGFGGFDCWGYNTDHPQGSGYVHAQGIQSGLHYATNSNGSAYGWQMVGAADASSRWWLRGRWGGSTYSWYEIMLSGRNVGYTLYANIFYDSDNTGYYVDPNGTSRIYKLYSNYRHVFDGNYGIGVMGVYSSTRYQLVWGMGESWVLPDDGTTTGNLYGLAWSHPNAGGAAGNLSSHGLLILENGGWTFASGGGSTRSTSDMRAPIFYDQNDTSYYCNPNSTSVFYAVNMWGRLAVDSPLDYAATGETGLTSAPLNSYALYDNNVGTTSYFLPFTHQTALYTSGYRTHCNTGLYKYASGWGDNNTGWYVALGGNDSYPTMSWRLTYGTYIINSNGWVGLSGSARSNVFYKDSDTSYYVNPNTWSVLWGLGTYYQRNNYDVSVDHPFGISFSTDNGNVAYGIYRESGGWSYPYPDLRIAFHTGIKIGGYYGYNGTRIYNNHDMSTQIASFGDGDNNFRSYYNIIAYASDQRLKENIVNIPDALEKVQQLNGVTFDWKTMVTELGFEPNTWHETGVLAQQVEAVLPEAVEIAPFDYDWKNPGQSKSGEKYLTVKYEKLVPLLIEAIKDQQKIIVNQEDRISRLESLIEKLNL